MSIIITLPESHAYDIASKFQCYDGVSYSDFCALFDYMEELSDDTGEPMDFDPVAWACDFGLHDSALEACQEHGLELDDDYEDDEDAESDAREALAYQTTFIVCPSGSVWVMAF